MPTSGFRQQTICDEAALGLVGADPTIEIASVIAVETEDAVARRITMLTKMGIEGLPTRPS